MIKITKEETEKALMDYLSKEKSICNLLDTTLCVYQHLIKQKIKFEGVDDLLEPYVTFGLQLIKDNLDYDEKTIKEFRELSCHTILALREFVKR